jgi:hypothetical protein
MEEAIKEAIKTVHGAVATRTSNRTLMNVPKSGYVTTATGVSQAGSSTGNVTPAIGHGFVRI